MGHVHNIYCPSLPVRGGFGDVRPFHMYVLTKDDFGKWACYQAIVHLPNPDLMGNELQKFEEDRKKAADWVHGNGLKMNFEDASRVFCIHEEDYRK